MESLVKTKQKINFHKLRHLPWHNDDKNANTNCPDDRIQDLEKEKVVAKNFINRIRLKGKRLRIDGVLNINLEE
ncbi:MAG: hypothetical protein AAGJ12_01915 [Bacteroidota bacterium]